MYVCIYIYQMIIGTSPNCTSNHSPKAKIFGAAVIKSPRHQLQVGMVPSRPVPRHGGTPERHGSIACFGT